MIRVGSRAAVTIDAIPDDFPGTSVPIGAVLNDLRERRLVVTALLGNLVLVPLLAVLLTRIMPVAEPAQNALILLGVCAGVPMMTRLTIMSHGERPFSIGIMILLMIMILPLC